MKQKIFFNGLNELRALAAFSVIFHHIELFKSRDHNGSLFNSTYWAYFIERLGKNGVYLFFVLSGFLITYLLLIEKDKLKKILFKKFYLRRIYRIWPLYYLIVIIGFFLVPFLSNTFSIFKNTPYFFSLISTQESYSIKSFLLYVFFLPNVALYEFNIVLVGCSQAWSVGVEEQFYILWPLLVFIFNKKKTFLFFLLILSFYVFLHIIIHPFVFSKIACFFSIETILDVVIYKLLLIIPFDFMAIGAIGGYLFLYYNEKITFFTKFRLLYLLVIMAILILMFCPIVQSYIQSVFLGILFLFLILLTVNDKNNYVFRNKYISHVGKISYGVYMYHPFVMFLVFPFANKYFPFSINSLVYNTFVYVVIFTLTVIISHFSYQYFESIFINIKDKKYKSL